MRRALFALCTVAVTLFAPARLIADVPLARVTGQPDFKGGKALGYFVWKDGDTWKVRWMTFGAEHRFSGRIVLEGGGEIKSMKRIDLDKERKVLAPGRAPKAVRGPRGRVVGRAPGRPPVVASRDEDKIEQETEQLIRFNTQTDEDVDGVDFKLSGDPRVVRFVLEIDGKPRPAEVEVGRDNFKPNEDPLEVRLR
jgi:hypothetical protein